MIKFLKDRILPLFMVAWLGGLLPACINDDEDTATGPEKTDGFNISIAISAGEASIARAEDGYDVSVAENYINIKDLQIYAFSTDGNNTLLAQVYPKPNDSNVAMDPSVVQIGNMYYLKAELSYDTFSKPENQNFKLVAVANRSQSEVEATKVNWTNLIGLTYTRTPSTTDNTSWYPVWNTSGIPMFGVQKVSLAGYSFKTNNQFDPFTLNDVNMLRAMAKIEVHNGIDPTITTITSVTLNAYQEGYIAPFGATGMSSTNKYVEDANVPENLKSLALNFYRPDENTFVAYIPELNFPNVNDRKMTVSITGGATFDLFLLPYTDGNPQENATDYPWNALLRNHIYSYTITGIGQNVTPVVNYTVCDWNRPTIEVPEFN